MDRDALSIIIPAAGIGRRMKSYGPKSTINLGNGEVVISRQIALLRDEFPNAEIIVVTGFEHDRVVRALPKGVHTVYNNAYKDCNVAYSIYVGLEACSYTDNLIVYGDLVFNRETLQELPNKSFVICDNKEQMRETEVGVTVIDGTATQFSYGLPTKWAQIAYLQEAESEMFYHFAYPKNKHKLFGFEILNLIINNGGTLHAIEPNGMCIAEIDTSKDIELARRIANENTRKF